MSGSIGRRATTRADVVASVVAISILLLLLGSRPGPSVSVSKAESQLVVCRYNLGQLGAGVAACMAENNGFVPTVDDGTWCGPSRIMLTWADLLYDLSYTPTTRYNTCPADHHPDTPTRQRGIEWDFRFVDRFGVGEAPRPGVRTSYAENFVLAYNWPEDRYEDASRQVYATDGWWCWLTCLNAIWYYYDEVTGNPAPGPTYFPSWYGTMVAWRHAGDVANALFCDGSVRPLTPIVPPDMQHLLTGTFNTEEAFTWLPGEQTHRLDSEAYHGTHPEWENRLPALSGGVQGQWVMNPALPNNLNVGWRSRYNAWIRLPNPANRP